MLDRAGALTPPGLRAAIARAVMEVAPEKAKQRREHAAKKTRVERWAEVSGNAGLAGRELPPAEVLAADQRVTAWARQLRKAGLEGGMDALRARAYLDMLLGMDSRPLGQRHNGTREPQDQPQEPAQPHAPALAGPLGRDDPGWVRRACHPDRPRGHRDRPRGPARRAGRASGPSTRTWPGTWPLPRPATPGPPGA